jgi:hypothetical protein
MEYLQSKRLTNTTADLAFYAYRDMESCDWAPFIKAAIERNPVSATMAAGMSIDEVYEWLAKMNDGSIYDGVRLAQPDEVANYKTGDGLEKAFVLANIIRRRDPEEDIELTADSGQVVLKGHKEFRFSSAKGFTKRIRISASRMAAVVE